MTNTIKAVVNVSSGAAQIQDAPYPELESEYIIVKPTYWAINPDDVYHLDLEGNESCAGTHVGSDYAGVVVEVGSGVTKDFKKGDRIAGWVTGQNTLRKSNGAFAEFIAVKGDAQMKIPDNVSDEDAATQGIALSTMALSLYRVLDLPLPSDQADQSSGRSLFLYGGSTAMGISAIQFAKLAGVKVIATASPSNFDYLKSLGADHVLNYKSTTLVDDALKLNGGPFISAFDTYPSDVSAAICAAVLSRDPATDARYVSLAPGTEKGVQSRNPAVDARWILAYSTFDEPYMYEEKFWDIVPGDFEFYKKFLALSEELFAQGKVVAPRVFLNRGGKGLEGVLHGLSEVRDNKVSGGKLVYSSV